MARRTYVPPELAPEARELLLGFIYWAVHPNQAGMLASEDWTWEQMVDAFMMEAGSNGDLEARLPEEGLHEAD